MAPRKGKSASDAVLVATRPVSGGGWHVHRGDVIGPHHPAFGRGVTVEFSPPPVTLPDGRTDVVVATKDTYLDGRRVRRGDAFAVDDPIVQRHRDVFVEFVPPAIGGS